jgi:hypothetical protein
MPQSSLAAMTVKVLEVEAVVIVIQTVLFVV